MDPDITKLSRRWAGSSKAFALLLSAVVQAEGDIVKAVQCTYPNVRTKEEALEITSRSACHALADFVQEHHAEAFVAFWAARWAPPGAANDPSQLNQNWPINVKKLWTKA